MLTSIRAFLQDLHDILQWLDTRDRQTSAAQPLPTNEKDAKKQLKEHEVISVLIVVSILASVCP